MSRFIEKCQNLAHQLFLEEVDCSRYAWIRIALSVVLFHWFWKFRPVAELLFSDNGFETIEQIGQVRPDSLDRFSLLFHFSSSHDAMMLLNCGLVLSVLLGLGFLTPVTNFLLYLIVASFRNRIAGWLTEGGTSMLAHTTFILMWAPSWKGYSLDALILRRLGWRYSRKCYSWILTLIKYKIVMGYYLSGYYKLMSSRWISGSALESALANPNWSQVSEYVGYWRVGPIPLGLAAATEAVIVWEFFFPLLVWWRRTRPWALLFGILMHLGIGFLMTVGSFPWAMLVSYLAWGTPIEGAHWVASVLRAMQARVNGLFASPRKEYR